MQDRVGAETDRLEVHLSSCGMEQGQDLACATPDILVRPDCRVTLRAPTAARLRYSPARTSLLPPPDRQAERGTEGVGPFDQPLFAAASGSMTVTRPPCLRFRTTTPASHPPRRFCH